MPPLPRSRQRAGNRHLAGWSSCCARDFCPCPPSGVRSRVEVALEVGLTDEKDD
jgi:hypothetical protein